MRAQETELTCSGDQMNGLRSKEAKTEVCIVEWSALNAFFSFVFALTNKL